MSNDGAGLDALVDVIETLQERIRFDRANIGSNETRTRTALIDPVLGALGWDDSSVVTPEYLVRYGPGKNDYRVADYALHEPGRRARPLAFIEAKRMREELTDDHRDQAFAYAEITDSARYVGLTNGDRWEFYEAREDRFYCIVDVSIRDESALHCAEQLLPFRAGASRMERTSDIRDGIPRRHRDTRTASRPSGGTQIHPPPFREGGHPSPVDTRRVLRWSFFSVLCGVIIGYFISDGLAVIVAGLILAVALIAASSRGKSRRRGGRYESRRYRGSRR